MKNNKGMKKVITLLAFQAICLSSIAQQEVMVSQYMFNGLFLNPAYSGTHPYFSSSLLYRNQWVDFEGAPTTQLLAIDGPIAQDKMGVGLIIAHDKIGVTEETDFFANYSYKLTLGSGKLSFGLKAGFSNYNAALTSLTYWDSGDEVFSSNLQKSLIPKFGFGMYYYTEKYYAGFSIPTLVAYDKNYDFGFNIDKSSYLRRHYFINGGYVFDLSETVKFKPSTLIKYLPSAPLQVDINASVMYKEMIWLGLSYRTGDALALITEYQANQRFRVGYSYDITLSDLRNYSSGSHEVMIGYDFGKDIIKTKTPRFF